MRTHLLTAAMAVGLGLSGAAHAAPAAAPAKALLGAACTAPGATGAIATAPTDVATDPKTGRQFFLTSPAT